MKNLYLIVFGLATLSASAQKEASIIDKLLSEVRSEFAPDKRDSPKSLFYIDEIYLNSDSILDYAIAEKEMCGGTGNCFWGLYLTKKEIDTQFLYLGMLSAASYELFKPKEGEFKSIKSFWKGSGANDGQWTISEFKEGKYRAICSGRYIINKGILQMKGINDCDLK